MEKEAPPPPSAAEGDKLLHFACRMRTNCRGLEPLCPVKEALRGTFCAAERRSTERPTSSIAGAPTPPGVANTTATATFPPELSLDCAQRAAQALPAVDQRAECAAEIGIAHCVVPHARVQGFELSVKFIKCGPDKSEAVRENVQLVRLRCVRLRERSALEIVSQRLRSGLCA